MELTKLNDFGIEVICNEITQSKSRQELFAGILTLISVFGTEKTIRLIENTYTKNTAGKIIAKLREILNVIC